MKLISKIMFTNFMKHPGIFQTEGRTKERILRTTPKAVPYINFPSNFIKNFKQSNYTIQTPYNKYTLSTTFSLTK